MKEFLMMDGHGIYVWTVYLMALVALSWIAAYPLIALRRLKSKQVSRQTIE